MTCWLSNFVCLLLWRATPEGRVAGVPGIMSHERAPPQGLPVRTSSPEDCDPCQRPQARAHWVLAQCWSPMHSIYWMSEWSKERSWWLLRALCLDLELKRNKNMLSLWISLKWLKRSHPVRSLKLSINDATSAWEPASHRNKNLTAEEDRNSLCCSCCRSKDVVTCLCSWWIVAPTSPTSSNQCSHSYATKGTNHSVPNSCPVLASLLESLKEKCFPSSPGRLFLLQGTSSLMSGGEKKSSRKNQKPGLNRQLSQAPLLAAHI